MKNVIKPVKRTILASRELLRTEILAGVVIAVTIIAVSYNTSNVILQNYRLEKDVREAQQKVSIAELELESQRLQNEYYKTDAFLEIAARKQLSKGLPDEKLVIVPKSVALALVPQTEDISTTQTTRPSEDLSSEDLNNFEKWIKFLGGNLEYIEGD